MTAPDPGRVLRRALLAWGFGHLEIGRRGIGIALIGSELVGLLLVAWLTVGLAHTSAYLAPFLAGVTFIVVWGWQAVDAYRSAQALMPARPPPPERSPAAVIGLLSVPLLMWGSGFWLIGAHSATPAAVLDRFVTEWSRDQLGSSWPAAVTRVAEAAASTLGPADEGRFRDVRVRMLRDDGSRATAVAEAIHFERRASRFLWIFPGSELVPATDERVLTLRLRAVPVELPGGGDIGAVTWELVSAE
ncbi:MAG: hypothetical protein M3153_00615 [Chloroflexota bacterium]|nr:hypothetical protein [Chloroflexota bacterium]